MFRNIKAYIIYFAVIDTHQGMPVNSDKRCVCCAEKKSCALRICTSFFKKTYHYHFEKCTVGGGGKVKNMTHG
jgi:hypothetical protein